MVTYRFSARKYRRVSCTQKGSRMALVILVRHGQTDENISGRISGQGPVPINARGQEQARVAAEVLAPLGITHIFSSPLVRARQTAEFLAGHLQKPIEEISD